MQLKERCKMTQESDRHFQITPLNSLISFEFKQTM